MTTIHFTSLGTRLDSDPHPLFIVDRMYPAKHFHLILSDEPNSLEKESVEENLSSITQILKSTGVSYDIHYLKLENFWDNVAKIAEMIVETQDDEDVILNLSTGRRVFIPTMVLAGSLAKGWMPGKNVTCVQTSKAYDKVVTFDPNLPITPDYTDYIIMKKINEFEEELENNPDAKLTTDEIGDILKKGQSTISTRIKKLNEADYVEIQGHSKFLKTKGKAILNTMSNLADKNYEMFNEEALEEKRRKSRQKWKKYKK